MGKFIELQTLGTSKIGRFNQAEFRVKKETVNSDHVIEVSGVVLSDSYAQQFGDVNGIYTNSSYSETIINNSWSFVNTDGVTCTLTPVKQGTNYWNGWAITCQQTGVIQYVAYSQLASSESEVTWPWIQWSSNVRLIGVDYAKFSIKCGKQRVDFADNQLITYFPPGEVLEFTASDLSGNKLTVIHSLGQQFVPGITCTVRPVQINYVNTQTFELDFTGISIAGTQQLWFPKNKGAHIQ